MYVYGPTQVKCWLLISSIFDAMNFQHFWKCWKLCHSISKKCWKFIASKILEIKSRHLTWVGPLSHNHFINIFMIRCNKNFIAQILFYYFELNHNCEKKTQKNDFKKRNTFIIKDQSSKVNAKWYPYSWKPKKCCRRAYLWWYIHNVLQFGKTHDQG